MKTYNRGVAQIALLIILGILVVGGGAIVAKKQRENNKNGESTASQTTDKKVKEETGTVVRKAKSDEVAEYVDANNAFAFDYFHRIQNNKNGNIFFSPYSITTALGMTFEGAKGRTAEEMAKVLHLSYNLNSPLSASSSESRRVAARAIYDIVNDVNSAVTIRTANALWVEKEFALLDDYLNVISEYFGGKAINVDFKSDAEKSRKTINSWIEDKTNDRIKDLLPGGSVSPSTRLILTNAIYFKGKWDKEFNSDNTKKADFDSGTSKIKTDLMFASQKFNYADTAGYQLLEMPYLGRKLSMVVLLPKNKNANWSDVNVKTFKELKSKLSISTVDVFFPKFRFDSKYLMGKDLMNMGMRSAFSESADFSGITGKPDLSISDVIHQAFVEVNEEGTEAAAATGVIMTTASAPERNIPVFRADHPFVFIIQDVETGNILFLGKVVEPKI